MYTETIDGFVALAVKKVDPLNKNPWHSLPVRWPLASTWGLAYC